MLRYRLAAGFAATLIGLVCVVKPAAGPGDVPVTSLVSDYDSGIAPSLQIQSDQLGAYKHSKTLTSVVNSLGWLLESYNIRNATRTVYLGFTHPVPGSGPGGGDPIAVPSGRYKVRMISKCDQYGNSMLALLPGNTIPCPLHIRFDYGADSYAVQMNPFGNGENPETDYANIRCIFPTSGPGPCTQWRITPSGTYTNADGTTAFRNVAALLKYVTAKGNTTTQKLGNFYFSFLMLVTNP